MPEIVLPTWRFVKRQPMSKQRDPIQGEFFNTESITTAADEVVREAIQNTLDAAVDSPVRVRFYVSGNGGALSTTQAARYFDGLAEHALACGAPSDLVGAPCRFVVVEDFGTTGLRGDEGSYEEPPPDEKNDFFYFFRAEGKSGKSGADRGRWGVGKYVFPKASNANTFFGMTVRCESGTDAPGPLVMGQAVMKNHKVADESFEPDGWWAVFSDEGVPVPAADSGTMSDFRSTWQVERNHEPGLSVVIPYADESLTVAQVRRSVVRDYFVAVLSGHLTVEIESGDGDDPIVITSDSIALVLDMLDDDERDQLKRNCDLVRWGLGVDPTEVVELVACSGSPAWGAAVIPEDTRERIRQKIAHGENVLVRVPVTITEMRGGPSRESRFDVLLAAEEGLRRLPLFVREGIIVSEALRSGTLHGIRAVVLVDEGALADLLGDAEGPAHTSWSDKTERFRGRYRYGARWLSFVRQAPAKILEIARGGDEEEDRTIAIDFFSVPTDEGDQESGAGQAGEEGGTTPPPPPPPPPPNPRKITVAKAHDGFTVSLTPDGATIQRIEVVAAYDRRRGNPFKKWTTDDFDLETMDLEAEGATLIERAGNRVVVQVTDPANFALRVRGFDVNRDLRVNARALEVA